MNMPTDFLFLQVLFAISMFLCLAKFLSNRQWIMAFARTWLSRKLFWGIPLRYLYEGYLELLIISLIGFFNMEW